MTAKELVKAGYEVYLPTLVKDIIHHRSKKRIQRQFPLFHRYMFVNVAADGWYTLGEVPGVGGYLPGEIPSEIVKKWQELETSGKFYEAIPPRLSRKQRVNALKRRYMPGSRRRVIQGPFTGFYGLVTNVEARGAVKLMMEYMGRETIVEFNAEQVE